MEFLEAIKQAEYSIKIIKECCLRGIGIEDACLFYDLDFEKFKYNFIQEIVDFDELKKEKTSIQRDIDSKQSKIDDLNQEMDQLHGEIHEIDFKLKGNKILGHQLDIFEVIEIANNYLQKH
jgi:uncharacterized coiled-coil DUF342 family protein